MVKFMREKAQLITWIIIIFFISTMFSGTIYLGFLKTQEKNNKQDLVNPENQLAYTNNLIIDKNSYNNYLNKLAYSLSEQGKKKITPDDLEIIMQQAFLKSLEDTVFLQIAIQNKVTISKNEINSALNNLYKTYKIKDKKELLNILKQNNVKYKDFIKKSTIN